MYPLFSLMERTNLQAITPNPVVHEIVTKLQSLYLSEDTSQIKDFIKYDKYFMKLVTTPEEALVRHHFKRLFARVLGLPIQAKFSLLKVCLMTALEAQIDMPLEDFYLALNQIAQIVSLNKMYHYSLVLKFFVPKIMEVYGFSLSLLKLKSMTKMIASLQPEYHIAQISVLVSLVTVVDPQVRETNKIVITREIRWLPKMFGNLLKSSRLILEALNGGEECIDPYNMYLLWWEEAEATEYLSGSMEILFRNALNAIEVHHVTKLYRELKLPITSTQISNLKIHTFPIAKGNTEQFVTDVLILYAHSIHYFGATTHDQQQDRALLTAYSISTSSEALIFRSIMLEIAQSLNNQKPNFYWLYPIKCLLQEPNSSSLARLLCESASLVETLIYYLSTFKENTHLIETSLSILELLCSNPKLSLDVLVILEDTALFAELAPQKLYYGMGFLTCLLGLYVSSKDNRTNSCLAPLLKRTQAAILKSIVEVALLHNPSNLFISCTLMPQSIQNSTLMIMTLIATDVQTVFNDWLKYQFQHELLNSEQKVLTVSNHSDTVAKTLKQWVLHYDTHPRGTLQKLTQMPYFQLRKMALSLCDIFSQS